jgi:hypothetical protein
LFNLEHIHSDQVVSGSFASTNQHQQKSAMFLG